MKNYYLLLLLTFFCYYSYAQTDTKLSIQGEAKKKVLPDISVIDITVIAKEQSEQASYKKLTERLNVALKKLYLLGFNDTQIKLNNFSIEPEYKRRNGLSIKTGFIASQNYSLRFPLDKLKILKVYTVLTEDKSDISLSFSTEISDSLMEKIQNELIEIAIDNARFKANIIARKINSHIKGILNIAYKYEGNIEPENIEITKYAPPLIVHDVESKLNEVNKLFSVNEIEFSETINFIFILGGGGDYSNFKNPVRRNNLDTIYQLKPTLKGRFIDQRDGQVYNCVKLANQIWMTDNLSFASPESWYYNNDSINKAMGRYYKISAALNACPANWHLPSDEEWQQLEIAAGMSESDAEQEMFRGTISPYFLTTGSMGFDVQFSGMRKQGYFDNNGTEAQFWTSTKKNKPTYTRLFKKADDRICKNLLGEAYSCNVRCIKNDTTTNDIKIIQIIGSEKKG